MKRDVLKEIIREELIAERSKQARLTAKELYLSVGKLYSAVNKGDEETASKLIAVIDRDFKKFRNYYTG